MLPQPKPQSRATDKRQRLKDKLANYRKVCAKVNARELWRCRCCHRPVAASAQHHHHITFRSKGGNDTSDNLVLLCAECHAEIHAYRLSITGTNANKPLHFSRHR